MGISTELKLAPLDALYLDPKNPRLGRHYVNANSTQEEVLEIMQDWTLDELAVSYIESGGFWTHEALLVVKEKLYGKEQFVVVEGNRRLAALMYLQKTVSGERVPRKWRSLVEKADVPAGFFEKLFDKIPYVLADSRQDIEAFLGFRHVTGIKQWNPQEKAQYITWLIDERGLTYEQVMRKIGSRTSTVREHYISYQLLLQIESTVPGFSPKYAEGRFSVMYLTVKKSGVRRYLQIDIKADPETAKRPVPEKHLKNLENFALWLFGNDDQEPLFRDSRQASDFNTILEDPKALQYLEDNQKPDFEKVFQLTRGGEQEVIRLINRADNNIVLSLSYIHRHKDSRELQKAIDRLAFDFKELRDRFSSTPTELEDD